MKTTGAAARRFVYSIALFTLLWTFCNGFIVSRTKKPRNLKRFSSPHSHGHQSQETEELRRAFDNVSGQFRGASTEDIQRALVQKGCSFAKASETPIDEDGALISPPEKVHGCIANVHVQTILYPIPEQKDSYHLTIKGDADALLSRGLVAIMATTLASQSAEAVLELQPEDVADRLGIRPALSPGRNDGLAIMVRTVQRQITLLLNPSEATRDIKESNPSADKDHTRHTRQPTVALLLSGGVDSSVALSLLKQQSYNVTAFYLKIWLEDELAHLGKCPWEDDYRMCQKVCEQAGVPLEAISLQEAYKKRVISYTVKEAEQGRTPNPDIMCNSRIKFGCFYDAIASRDFDYVASGHYAQLRKDEDSGLMRLVRAPDPIKDQSYFLCALTQDQLRRVKFPIGHLQKSEVRALAEEFKLPNRNRPDSQGLCFLGKVKFEEFLAAYLGERPGKIVDAATGDLLGEHKGVWYHTVGQRKGIGKVLDPLATSRGPWYVVAKDPENDIVFCSNQYDEEIFTASRSQFTVEDIKWIPGKPPASMVNGSGCFTMKIRHGPRLVEGSLTLTDSDGIVGDVKLDRKDSGLAPGQYVVFYDDEECLGGGVISERHWAKFLVDRQEIVSLSSTR